MANVLEIFRTIELLTSLPSNTATSKNISAYLSTVPESFVPLDVKHPYIAHRIEIAMKNLKDNAIVTSTEKAELRARMQYLLTGK